MRNWFLFLKPYLSNCASDLQENVWAWFLACRYVKFVFSKKATKIDEIFNVELTLSNRRWRFRQFLWQSCILMLYLIIRVFLLFVRISLIAKNIWTLRRHSLGHWLIDVVKNVTKVSRNRYVFIWFQTFHKGVNLFWRRHISFIFIYI